MTHSLLVKSGLLLTILTLDLAMYSPVKAEVAQKIPQNLQQLEPQGKQFSKQLSSPTSQQQWEEFRQRQDEQMLRQQQRLEQFRLQNELRQQQPPGRLRQQPVGQFRQNQLIIQQRQQMDTLRLQQKLRQQP
ncbi:MULTISPECIES: hypothetical protein [Calothrix]|uniref:Uncharacterized protein n=2 Tax=Calothrix TaxID=1186 RepID=A0ABR8AKP7_9CYAN|nr:MULTISPECIES: hypothetical protein [Calothrix]MBD2199192.1 hypothetical protein [Calothrix parietina FACHB-288]MBD2227894.1 hypothetical protein [Calothrix anomala FACHB-343]